MIRRTLGSTEIIVGTLGLGCNAFGTRVDVKQSTAVIQTALDEGITLFDTADVYGDGRSEEILGRALGAQRATAVIATKFGKAMPGNEQNRGASPRYIRSALEASLRRLRTDYVDLYQLHRPDPDTPIADTLGVLGELQAEGKVRAVGCSNFAAWELVAAACVSDFSGQPGFATVQNEYSLYNRAAESELIPACAFLGTSLIPFFPLASGLLSGKYRRGEPPAKGTRMASPNQRDRLDSVDWDLLDMLLSFAGARDLELLEVAIGGLIAQSGVAAVIVGATRQEQIRANVTAADWVPSEEDLAELNGIRRPAPAYATFATNW